MDGKDRSGRGDLEELRRRLAAREEERALAAEKKRQDLEELRRRMEARAARADGRAAETAADSNIEELRRHLAARRDAEARGIRYDDGRGNGRSHLRGRRHMAGRNPYPGLAQACVYRCVPVIACLLVFAVSLGIFRTAVTGSAGAVPDDRYAAARAKWLAENVVDVKDPPTEPEVLPPREIEAEVLEAGPVLLRAEAGPVQGPMPAYGPVWEAPPEEEPVPAEALQSAAVPPERDAGPSAQAKERKVPQEDAADQADADVGTLPADGTPQDDTGDETPPSDPVFPEDGATLPADGAPQDDTGVEALPAEPVLPEEDALLPADGMPQEDTDAGAPRSGPVVPEEDVVFPGDGTPFPPLPVEGPGDWDVQFLPLPPEPVPPDGTDGDAAFVGL